MANLLLVLIVKLQAIGARWWDHCSGQAVLPNFLESAPYRILTEWHNGINKVQYCENMTVQRRGSLNRVWGTGVRKGRALNSPLGFNREAESIQDRNKNNSERTGSPKEEQECQVEFDIWYVGVWSEKSEYNRQPQGFTGSWVLC